jgi:hypothetical protein
MVLARENGTAQCYAAPVTKPSRLVPRVIVFVASLASLYWLLPPSAALVWATTAAALAALAWTQRSPSLSPRVRRYLGFGGVAIPVGLMLVLYWRVLQTWWFGDDPAILWAVASHGALAHFWSPAVWREFSSSNFTPWVILSFGFDWHFFRLDPTAYYWHQLASLVLVLVVAFTLLTRFVRPTTACLALCLFVASGPVATVSQQLMTRHYLEGLCLALMATVLFIRAVEGRGGALPWLGGVCYLAACSAKEVFVPLVLVLPFLPVSDTRARLRKLHPFLLALAVYIAWRAWMLGPSRLLAGYGNLFSGSGSGSLSKVVARVEAAMGWSGVGALAVLLVLGSLLVALAMRREKRGLLLFGALAVAGAGPLVPVLRFLDPRMLLVPCFSLAVGLAIAVSLLAGQDRWRWDAIAVALALLAAGLTAVRTSPMWTDRSVFDRYRVEGQAVLTGSPDLPLMQPVGAPWFYTCLDRLRTALYGSSGPPVCYDVCACAAADRYQKGLRFDSGRLSETALDVTGCRFRRAPMRVEFSYDTRTDVLRWTLSPYADGQWYYMDDTGYRQPVPAHGFYPLRISTIAVFLIRYVSPQGWSTQSPRFRLDPSSAGRDGIVRLSWSGDGGLPGTILPPG